MSKYTRLPINELSTSAQNALRKVQSFTFADNLRFNKRVSLERLSYLALGDACLNQFELSPKKVLNFLLDPTIGLMRIGKILTPIEVGVVYASDWELEDQSDLPELDENECTNEFTFTVSGRHRITALLTWAHINGIDPKDVLLPVTVSYYQTWEDAALAVLAANASRTMTPTEKLNVTVQSREVDTQNVNQLASSADSNKHAKEAFILLVSSKDVSTQVGLERNTLASLARSFLTCLSKHKGVLSWFSNPSVLAKIGGLFVASLEETLKTKDPNLTNVARYASHIGKLVYSNVEFSDIEQLGLEFKAQQQPKPEAQKQQLQLVEDTQDEQPTTPTELITSVEPSSESGTDESHDWSDLF